MNFGFTYNMYIFISNDVTNAEHFLFDEIDVIKTKQSNVRGSDYMLYQMCYRYIRGTHDPF